MLQKQHRIFRGLNLSEAQNKKKAINGCSLESPPVLRTPKDVRAPSEALDVREPAFLSEACSNPVADIFIA